MPTITPCSAIKPADPCCAEQVKLLAGALADLQQQSAQNEAEQRRIEGIGQTAQANLAQIEQLRQQRADLYTQQIISGTEGTGSADLAALDAQIEASRADERSAQDLQKACAAALTKLRGDAAELRQKHRSFRNSLEAAQLYALENEIRSEHLPAFVDAFKTFAAAYAVLVGTGRVHALKRDELHKAGVVSHFVLGSTHENPPFLEVLIFGFGFADEKRGVWNRLSADLTQEVEQAAAEARQRWGV